MSLSSIRAAVVVALVAASLPVGAQTVSDAELLMLPPYCHARIKGGTAEKAAWGQRMGREQFLHVHHHCFGLNFLTKASAEFDPKQRRYLLQRAVANFNYVLRRWPANFPLTAEARNFKMQAEAQLAQIR